MVVLVDREKLLKAIIPIIIGIIIAIIPHPSALTSNAWYYFALFATVIAATILEPMPIAAISLIGVVVAVVARLVYSRPSSSISWGLTGFSNSIVWLIFAAYLFALGYSKTGLGRRIALIFIKYLGKKPLGLGYAIALSDLVLAPFMPSNTARSGGTIFPIVSNIPPMYGSSPREGTEKKIGSYLMWTAFAATCITSSMFLTGLAPNVLVQSLAAKQGIQFSWITWFIGFAPVGIFLFIITPYLIFKMYPPEIKESPEAPKWAQEELNKMGKIKGREIAFLIEVILALVLWIIGSNYIDATAVALLVVALSLLSNVYSWKDILTYESAWNTLVWFATLFTLADGLSRVGFVSYVGKEIATSIGWMSPTIALIVIVSLFYWLHYMFASLTAHATALFPIFLATAMGISGMNPVVAAYALSYTLGIMGIISPYATGPAPVYYGSGYIKGNDFWKLGLIFGIIYYVIFIAIGMPWLLFILK
ncbi:MAG: anion permease [Fervidicoccus fontis]|uniref:Anion permease n=1 Tax=Fervidicoccus fontis TaxID=683846 RepID=A0A2J6N343_9CREN|nr:MAG: anion permease [Fervidicoccus fontis]PMB78138.1 MAG: anion permease [Fervidicoccus fontis]